MAADFTGGHALRHTFGIRLVREGHDLVLVAELMGHARLETTTLTEVRRSNAPAAPARLSGRVGAVPDPALGSVSRGGVPLAWWCLHNWSHEGTKTWVDHVSRLVFI
ncbi:tyrosine-type recombinase/integrase [Salinispora arenicola]|uniref:tyrosine-type recombinase/integrase n=1 Tax=Salinispora arenicola TaxID=168697 RepID=UPI0009B7AD4C